MRFAPKGYGGHRVRRAYAAALQPRSHLTPEQVRRDGWHEQHMLAVSLDDHRLTWPERELVRQLGERLYGKLPAVREVRND
ncbi:hypothetical protein V8324_12665 [Roseovarius sp. D22-M7]